MGPLLCNQKKEILAGPLDASQELAVQSTMFFLVWGFDILCWVGERSECYTRVLCMAELRSDLLTRPIRHPHCETLFGDGLTPENRETALWTECEGSTHRHTLGKWTKD